MGKYSINDINRVLKGTDFTSDKKPYMLIKLAKKDYSRLMVFLAKLKYDYADVIRDENELSLFILEKIWRYSLSEQFTPIAIEPIYAKITCRTKKPTVTGFLLRILKVISPADIGVCIKTTFSTDHIFVYYQDLNKALLILNKLKNNL